MSVLAFLFIYSYYNCSLLFGLIHNIPLLFFVLLFCLFLFIFVVLGCFLFLFWGFWGGFAFSLFFVCLFFVCLFLFLFCFTDPLIRLFILSLMYSFIYSSFIHY